MSPKAQQVQPEDVEETQPVSVIVEEAPTRPLRPNMTGQRMALGGRVSSLDVGTERAVEIVYQSTRGSLILRVRGNKVARLMTALNDPENYFEIGQSPLYLSGTVARGSLYLVAPEPCTVEIIESFGDPVIGIYR